MNKPKNIKQMLDDWENKKYIKIDYNRFGFPVNILLGKMYIRVVKNKKNDYFPILFSRTNRKKKYPKCILQNDFIKMFENVLDYK